MSIIVVHNVIIIGRTVGCVFSASCSNYAFHARIFSAQQTFTTSYFRRTILGLVGKISSLLKINKWGKECPGVHFWKKINSRGGDIYSGLESNENMMGDYILNLLRDSDLQYARKSRKHIHPLASSIDF